jgi:predicted nucleic acid-binding protein
MTGVDTNLLVYADREDSPWHDAALAKITDSLKRNRIGRFRGRVYMNFLSS